MGFRNMNTMNTKDKDKPRERSHSSNQGSRIMGTSKFRTKSVRNYTSVPVIVECTENMLEIKLEKFIRTW